jgi:hypothetical protein
MEKKMTEQESLRLITEMIQKARGGRFHEGGEGAILWGSVVGLAGILTFFHRLYKWPFEFDWWFLPLFALIPNYFLTRAEKRKKLVKSHEERALDTVWIVFGISVFCLAAYGNVATYISANNLEKAGLELLERNIKTGELKQISPFVPSFASLMMVLYAFPTLVTGIVLKFKPMLWGALFCYALFCLSLFTSAMYDQLLSGIAGIVNWLIPGLILRHRYIARHK